MTRRTARARSGVTTAEQPIALARRSARRSRIAAWILGGFGVFMAVAIVAPQQPTDAAVGAILSSGSIAGSVVAGLRARKLTRQADEMVAALAGPAVLTLEPVADSQGHQALVRLQKDSARLAVLTAELATAEPDLVLVARASEQALGRLARRVLALELTGAPDADINRLMAVVTAGLDGYEDLVRAAAGVVARMTTVDALRMQQLHRATEQLRYLEQGLREVAAINEPFLDTDRGDSDLR